MTKRFTVDGNWIKDNWIDKLLNINFNTINDAMLCCDLLNYAEDKKLENGKIATQLLKENEQLKTKNNAYIQDIEVFKEHFVLIEHKSAQMFCTLLNWINDQADAEHNRRMEILDILSDLENQEEWWTREDLLGALDKIAVVVGWSTEKLGER